MCGILYVESQTTRPLQQHLAALDILRSRGPDFVRYQHSDRVFIAQSVLHITGSKDFYNEKRSDFFAYNGEIYNYRWHGRYNQPETTAIDSNILKAPGPGCTGTDQR